MTAELLGWLPAVGILAAGFWAGMINVIVGSGTLVSFPVLVLFGYPPLVANISNNIGLIGGNISGTIGYRREIAAHRGFAVSLLPASVAGGICGALLLLVLPPEAFNAIVPALIGVGLVMVVIGPTVQRAVARHADAAEPGHAEGRLRGGKLAAALAGMFVLGLYGGYFGAAQGILIMGLLGLLTTHHMQTLNAAKNLLVLGVNIVATLVFLIVAWPLVDLGAVILIAAGATAGGVVGARYGRRLPENLLRAIIIVVGVAAMVYLVFFPG